MNSNTQEQIVIFQRQYIGTMVKSFLNSVHRKYEYDITSINNETYDVNNLSNIIELIRRYLDCYNRTPEYQSFKYWDENVLHRKETTGYMQYIIKLLCCRLLDMNNQGLLNSGKYEDIVKIMHQGLSHS